MGKPRFSIRTLLTFVSVVAVLVWWTTLPSVTAARFVNAVNQREFDRAANMFRVEGPHVMLTSQPEWQPAANTVAWMPRLTIGELLRGRRRIELSVTYQGPQEENTGYFPLEASILGVYAQPTTRDFQFHQ